MLDDGGLSVKDSKDAPVIALIKSARPKETTLLIGDDSFMGMLERIDLDKVPLDRVRIFTRGATVLKIPPVNRPIVEIVDLGAKFKGLSSTQIRSARKNGDTLPRDVLHPLVQKYINRNELYKGRPF
jgi:nicotinic acid mononucleotide adenylyltransferase